jgi:hypothetical protein
MLEDYIAAAHDSDDPEDKGKAADRLAKLTGQFKEEDKSLNMPVINWFIGKNHEIQATIVPPVEIVESTPAETKLLEPPETKPESITFALDFDFLKREETVAKPPAFVDSEMGSGAAPAGAPPAKKSPFGNSAPKGAPAKKANPFMGKPPAKKAGRGR